MSDLTGSYTYPNNKAATPSVVTLQVEREVYSSIDKVLNRYDYYYPRSNDKRITTITDYLITADTLDIDHLLIDDIEINSISHDPKNSSASTLVTGLALTSAIADVQKEIDVLNPDSRFGEDAAVLSMPIADPAFVNTEWEWLGWEIIRGGSATFTPSNKKEINERNYLKLKNYPFYREGKYFISIDITCLDSGSLYVLDEADRVITRAITPGMHNFIYIPANYSVTTLKFKADSVLQKEQISISRINIYYITPRLERYMNFIVPLITSGGSGYASEAFVNQCIEDLEVGLAEKLDKLRLELGIFTSNDVAAMSRHIGDITDNPHHITPTMIGAARDDHKHTPLDIGAAYANHTHTPESIGAAPINHVHSIDALGMSPVDHTHTPESIGAADRDHTHTLSELGAAADNHTHTLIELNAASRDHTHTPNELDAASKFHTHNPADIGAADVNHTHNLADLGTIDDLGGAHATHTHLLSDLGTIDDLDGARSNHTHSLEDLGAASVRHTHDEYVTKTELRDLLLGDIDFTGFITEEDVNKKIDSLKEDLEKEFNDKLDKFKNEELPVFLSNTVQDMVDSGLLMPGDEAYNSKINKPIMTIPDTLIPSEEIKFKVFYPVTEGSMIADRVSLTVRELDIENQTYTLNPDTHEAELSIIVPDDATIGSVYTVRVVALYQAENSKATMEKVPVGEYRVNTPEIISPKDNQLFYLFIKGDDVATSTISVQVSPFSVSGDIADTQLRTVCKICKDSYGKDVIIDKQMGGSATSFILGYSELSKLTPDNDYYLLVQQVGVTLGESNWSIPVKLCVRQKYIEAPTILQPTNNITVNTQFGLFVETTPAKIVGDTNVKQVSSVITLIDMITEEVVFEGEMDTPTTHELGTDILSVLDTGHPYRIRVKAISNGVGESPWSIGVRINLVKPVTEPEETE